ncbi:hypothetical protein EON65_36945 [archaeon]|nr:MAG: hypothetical protein EON65_36945 [archaeon]
MSALASSKHVTYVPKCCRWWGYQDIPAGNGDENNLERLTNMLIGVSLELQQHNIHLYPSIIIWLSMRFQGQGDTLPFVAIEISKDSCFSVPYELPQQHFFEVFGAAW